jgi:hypothetical protein
MSAFDDYTIDGRPLGSLRYGELKALLAKSAEQAGRDFAAGLHAKYPQLTKPQRDGIARDHTRLALHGLPQEE